VELAPLLIELSTSGSFGGPLVDEHDRRGPPERDLRPERPDAGPQHRVRGVVPGARDLVQVRDPVARGDERVVGGVNLRVAGEDRRLDQPAPERPPQPALVVVAGLDADRRWVQPDE
jgi:hypothetical protein